MIARPHRRKTNIRPPPGNWD